MLLLIQCLIIVTWSVIPFHAEFLRNEAVERNARPTKNEGHGPEHKKRTCGGLNLLSAPHPAKSPHGVFSRLSAALRALLDQHSPRIYREPTSYRAIRWLHTAPWTLHTVRCILLTAHCSLRLIPLSTHTKQRTTAIIPETMVSGPMTLNRLP